MFLKCSFLVYRRVSGKGFFHHHGHGCPGNEFQWENAHQPTGFGGTVQIIHFDMNFQLILTWKGRFLSLLIWEFPFIWKPADTPSSLAKCVFWAWRPGLVAQYFDERNPAVMKGLETLIKAAKAKGKWGHPGATQGPPRGQPWAIRAVCSDYQYKWIVQEFHMKFIFHLNCHELTL